MSPTARFLEWFFVREPRLILHTAESFLLWAWKYFSIGYFLPRLFSPWHRDISFYGRGFDFKRFFHTLGWNLISRVLGAIMRLVVMAVGIVAEGGILAFSAAVFLVWFVLPLLSLALFIVGIFTLASLV